jgi:hypothetical protein
MVDWSRLQDGIEAEPVFVVGEDVLAIIASQDHVVNGRVLERDNRRYVGSRGRFSAAVSPDQGNWNRWIILCRPGCGKGWQTPMNEALQE